MHKSELRRHIAATTYRVLYWGRNHVAPGLRSLLGVLFMAGGVLGFLPVLGFWMFPLGVAFVALDVPSSRHRIDRWMMRLAQDAELLPPAPAPERSSSARGAPLQADQASTSSQ